MDRSIDCTQFETLLNDYLDNELDSDVRAAFLAHTAECPQCAEKLNDMQKLLTMCAELDEGLVMPLDAQAAWRKAVGEEARSNRRVGSRSFIRAVSGIAAAVVLLLGGTYALRNMGSLSPETLQPNHVFQETIERNFPRQQPLPTNSPYVNAADSSGAPSRTGAASPVTERDGGLVEQVAHDELDAESMAFMDDAQIRSEEPEVGADLDAGADKLIRSASIDMETTNFDADLEAINDLVAEYDGKIETSHKYGQPLEPGMNYGRNAYLSVRVPTDQLDDFLAALNFGTITAQSVYNQDISRSYYDLEGRLDAKKAVRDKLIQLIESAESFADLLEGERQIAEVQSEIDSMEGTIRNWDYRIDSSQISITLTEVAERNVVAPLDSTTFGERIRTGFYDSINLFLSFMQDFLVLLVLIAPELILAVIVIIIVMAVVRRHRRRKRAQNGA